MERDIYYPWSRLVGALLQEDIMRHRELEAERKRGNPEHIAFAESQQAASYAEYKQALKDWVLCVLRYDPSQPLVQMEQEAISILLPRFDWKKARGQ